MKWSALILLAAGLAGAQESTTYVYDVNGERSVSTRSSTARSGSGKTMVESVPTMNGQAVANEQVDERVLEETPSSRIVERVITYPNGDRAKVRTEEKKLPGGGSTTATTRYRDDGNGTMVIAERTLRQATGDGASETTVERPSMDGSLAVVEKLSGTTRKSGGATEQTVVVYRPDASGSFVEAVREVSLRQQRNGVATETKDEYLEGQLNGRTVTSTRKAADGTQTQEISIYGMVAAGQTVSDKPQLREQRLVEKRPSGPNQTTETLSIRRPALDDTRQLGSYEVVSQTVCTGCKP